MFRTSAKYYCWVTAIVAKVAPVIVLASICSATTVVVFMTPAGIIIGTDGQQFTGAALCSPYLPDKVPARKAFLITDRVAVANVGLLGILHVQDWTVYSYSFADTLKHIRMPPHASLSAFDPVWAALSDGLFFAFDTLWATGDMKRANWPEDVFTQLLFIGYDGPIARVISVTYKIDWEKKGLFFTRSFDQDSAGYRYGLRMYGYSESGNVISDRKSAAHKFLMREDPTEFMMFSEQRDLTVVQAKKLVSALIKMEATLHPETVGLPEHLLFIPKPST